MALDTQQIELVGRAALEAELIKRGFEVARPHRDKGIDLLVFLDEPTKPFAALPVQVKVSTGTRFEVKRKYERMTGLVLVYIWDVLRSPRFFLMDYAEAAGLIPEKQKAKPSWRNKPLSQAGWGWNQAPKHVVIGLAEFENRWDWLKTRLIDARSA